MEMYDEPEDLIIIDTQFHYCANNFHFGSCDNCSLVDRRAAVGVELLSRHDEREDVDASGDPAVDGVLKAKRLVNHTADQMTKSIVPAGRPDQQQSKTPRVNGNAPPAADPRTGRRCGCSRRLP